MSGWGYRYKLEHSAVGKELLEITKKWKLIKGVHFEYNLLPLIEFPLHNVRWDKEYVEKISMLVRNGPDLRGRVGKGGSTEQGIFSETD